MQIPVFSGEAVTDTAQNATTLGDLVKFMINLAQMQGPQNAEVKALANSVNVNASGTVLKISASLPQETFTKMLEPAKKNTPGLHAAPGTRR